MTERRDPLLSALHAHGADLARWPDASDAARARRALVADPAFRSAWETERAVDAALAEHRRELDAEVRAAGRLSCVRAGALSRLARRPGAIRWSRVAAAMLAAAFLGGAAGEMLLKPVEPADAATLVLLDPTAPEIDGAL